MSQEDGRPQKPSDVKLPRYLRFVDPDDPTDVGQFAIVDTGVTTPDGKKIYAIAVSQTGPGGEGAYSEDPMILFPYNRSGMAEVCTEVALAGARKETLLGTTSNVQVDPSTSSVNDLLEFFKCRRVQGFFEHSAEAPGVTLEIDFKDIYHYNGFSVYVRRRLTIPLDVTNQFMHINLPAYASYGKVSVINQSGDIMSYKMFLEGVPT